MPKDCLPEPYPGAAATAPEILLLARAYQSAAHALLASAGRDRLAAMPAHLCALQAVELATVAWRRHAGETPGAIRARRHDLSCPALAAALGLRSRTAAHLSALAARRAYLVVRYAPEPDERLSPRTRMTATLDEVLAKVAKQIAPPGDDPARTRPTVLARRSAIDPGGTTGSC